MTTIRHRFIAAALVLMLWTSGAVAGSNEGLKAEEPTATLFRNDIVKELEAGTQEGTVIALPDSNVELTYIGKTENGDVWSTNRRGINVIKSFIADKETGKESDCIQWSHEDTKKKITRGLQQMIVEDGQSAYSIYKTDKKGTIEYPLTTEQYAEAEQAFRSVKTFDALWKKTERAAKAAAKKAKERDEALYLFTQETFDYLETVQRATAINHPYRGDKFTNHVYRNGMHGWWLNGIYNTQLQYEFEEDEEGKKILKEAMVFLSHFTSAGDGFDMLRVSYQEDEPKYIIDQTWNTYYPVERTRIQEQLTQDQFVWAAQQFRKNRKKFSSIIKEAPNR